MNHTTVLLLSVAGGALLGYYMATTLVAYPPWSFIPSIGGANTASA
jgi:hypothetical protein